MFGVCISRQKLHVANRGSALPFVFAALITAFEFDLIHVTPEVPMLFADHQEFFIIAGPCLHQGPIPQLSECVCVLRLFGGCRRHAVLSLLFKIVAVIL